MFDIRPGEIIEYDYRSSNIPSVSTTSLKILQWNVERNYEADGILKKIKELDPDVCVLQEIDIDCRRSGNRNHMEELCKTLKMKGVFVCEFWELESPLRKDRDQGGGLHGNAILTKHELTDIRVIDHQYQPFFWERDGALLNEPRKGRQVLLITRYTLASVINRPTCPSILIYNVHLEVFTGIIGRVSVFSELFQDAHFYTNQFPYQAIFGDLNTMAHSIARLSPKYARDRYRFLSLGETEASWFDRNILGYHIMDGPLNIRLLTMQRSSWTPLWILKSMFNSSNKLISNWGLSLGIWLTGFSADVMIKARNPGFYDGWPIQHDTLHNPAYFGLFKAKLDWTLLRNMEIKHQQYGNIDYKLSDHQYLMMEVDTDSNDILEDDNRRNALWLLRRQQFMNTHRIGYSRYLVLFVLLVLVLLALVV
ncbi:uncharacterized protein BX664DRAFT_387599 [Halteromyces radiatus]|uniref:uncharacterized protein n=1 Tax=Halteromyces radiatus TaxID=101107 RepID=UPI00221F091F|nr:uncharacterized protein BX664DRAFT_387599 [Halteromyces radiatus]KAI8084934.1 hypothetical protein BX664DRAFT_387599 [Halteromyces radiatus]